MREILFRGFHPDKNAKQQIFVNGEWIKGEWVYGAYSQFNWTFIGKRENKPQIIVFDENIEIDGLWADVIPETVEQYTGLTDKNGKKIFEGDILDSHFTRIAIYYDEQYCQFRAKEKTGLNNTIDYYTGYPICYEVIGNIHDNPELIEERK